MAEYNPSKIIKDGNTYNFRDTTKIPLAGSNKISGSLIPSTDGTVNLGSPNYQWNNAYIKSLTINGVVCGDILTHNVSEFALVSDLSTVATSGSYNDLSNKPTIPTVNNGTLTIQQNGTTVDTFTANSSSDKTVNIECVDLTNNQTVGGNKEFTGTTTAHDVIPSATDTYNFGSSSAQWNNAYVKSLTINGVACGDILTHNVSEFVDVSGNQTIGGNKTFSGSFSVNKPSPRLQMKSTTYSSETTSAMTIGDIVFLGNDGRLSAWIVNQLRDDLTTRLCFRNFPKGGSTYKGFIFDENCNLYPENSNNTLGTSTNKWKSFNGINPGALSLPGTSVNVDTTNWVLDGSNVNSFTPASDGWLGIQVTDTVYDQMHYVFVGRTGGGNAYYSQNVLSPINALWDGEYHGCVFIPVVKNVNYDIRCICSTIVATFYPCQGNV